ncbi:MAG: copper resistance CopC family protein [Acidimicrobiales bacterium]
MARDLIRRLAAVVFGALAVALTLTLSSPVGAHTDLLQGSPGPAQQAGGEVDFIDLVFFEPVSNAVVTLEDPNGAMVDGSMTNADGQIIRFENEPLTETGRYIVRYSMDSADGDFTEGSYFFTYHPDSTQPVRLGELAGPSTLNTVAKVGAGVVFAGCMIGLAMIFLTKLERDRAAASNS